MFVPTLLRVNWYSGIISVVINHRKCFKCAGHHDGSSKIYSIFGLDIGLVPLV